MKTADSTATIKPREPAVHSGAAAAPAPKFPFDLLLRRSAEREPASDTPPAREPPEPQDGQPHLRRKERPEAQQRPEPVDRTKPPRGGKPRTGEYHTCCELPVAPCDDEVVDEEDAADDEVVAAASTQVAPAAADPSAATAQLLILDCPQVTVPLVESVDESNDGETSIEGDVLAAATSAEVATASADAPFPDAGNQIAASEPHAADLANEVDLAVAPADDAAQVADAALLSVADDVAPAKDSLSVEDEPAPDAADAATERESPSPIASVSEASLNGESSAKDKQTGGHDGLLPESQASDAASLPKNHSAEPAANAAGVGSATAPAAIVAPAHGRSFPHLVPRGEGEAARPARPVEIDAARLLHRVARAFQIAQQRGSDLKLRLNPPDLGSLRLELRIEEGVMTARVEAETQTARSALVENLPALRERLAEQGIRIERFDVDLMQQQGEGPGAKDQGTEWESGRVGERESGRTAQRQVDNPLPLPPSPPHPLSDSSTSLNVIV